MAYLRIKNIMNRPRVFSVITRDGMVDSLRFRANESLGEIDARLVTVEIAQNVRSGHLLLMDGVIPEPLVPYAPSDAASKPAQAAPKKPPPKTQATTQPTGEVKNNG